MLKERLEKDLKALEMVKIILVDYAISLLEQENVMTLLKTTQTLDDILEKCGLKNKQMLENILDLLVGQDILGYNKGYYLKPYKKINTVEATNFLNKNYKESLEWVNFVNQYSKNTLITGNPSDLTGFEEKQAVYYWNKIMEQSPYSLRVLAILELYKDLKPNVLILDYGCGGGVSLEQLIELSHIPIQFIGADPSTKFFEEARSRIKKLKFKEAVKIKNQKNVKFESIDSLNNYSGAFDGIFVSIIFNHIKQEDYIDTFKKLSNLLKSGGKLVIVQLMDFGKYDRNPIWIMHNIPSHKGYPMKDRFIHDLNSVFPKVEEQLNGIITISTK